MQTITLEINSEEVLNLLRNLEKLKLIKLVETDEKTEDASASLSGSISKKSADLLRTHLKTVRKEWGGEGFNRH